MDPSTEDPHVAPVEAPLRAAATPYDAVALDPYERPRVEHALWICACVTSDDAPTWLVHDTTDGALAWCRVATGEVTQPG